MSLNKLRPIVALRHHHAQTVRNGDFSHKIDYVAQVSDILKFKGHPNCTNGC